MNDVAAPNRNIGTVYAPYCADADDYVKQKFLFTTLCVTGKKATVQQEKVDAFVCELERRVGASHPLLVALSVYGPAYRSNIIVSCLKYVKMGQYNKLTAALMFLTEKHAQDNMFIHRATREQLARCPGIGFKTASFFLLNTRPGCAHAVLDTHTLAWLRSKGHKKAPYSSPQEPRAYAMWEAVFFEEMFKEGKTIQDIAAFDLSVWKAGAGIT